MKQAIALLATLGAISFGSATPRADESSRHFLLDGIVNDAKEVHGALLPSRVYFHFAPSIKGHWIQVLTTPQGRYPKPLEALMAGTVLEGKDIGAEDANAHFKLNQSGLWVATRDEEIYRAYVMEKVPKLKVLDFQDEGLVPLAPHP